MPALPVDAKYKMVKELMATLMDMSQGEDQFQAGRRDGLGMLQRYCEQLDQYPEGDE